MACQKGSPNCTTANAAHQYGILSGYGTTSGYDLATGLGSVNATNLVNKWTSVSRTPSVTTITSLTPASITHGQSVNVAITVARQSGPGATPTGNVSLTGGANNSNLGIDAFTLTNGGFAGSTKLLPGGTYNVTAYYPGDGTYASSTSAPVSVTVNKEASSTALRLITFDSAGRIANSNATSATYGSPYILRVNVTNSAGSACTPNTPSELDCASGAVNLTDNGTALDGGAFTLNSYGYVEDQLIQLTGGTHNVQAQYAGDNSFNASTGNAAVNIVPAATTIGAPDTCCNQVGFSMQASVTISTHSNGAAPGGTVKFYSNGTLINGNVSYQSLAGSANTPASLFATLISSSDVFPTPGTYNITAVYSGDTNYAAATSAGTSLSVKFPQPTIDVQPSASSIVAGSPLTLTITALGSSKTIAPTGTFTIRGSVGSVSGAISYSTVTNPVSGNLDLKGTIKFSPAFSDAYSVEYSGDINFPASTGIVGTIQVTGTDFSLAISGESSMTLSPGGSGTVNILIGTQTGSAPVTFASNPCTGLPAESTCMGPPPTGFTSFAQITVSTTAPHNALLRGNTSGWLYASFIAVFGFLIAGGGSTPRRRARGALICCFAMAFLVGCGGGSNNNGPRFTDPGTPKGNYTVTVTGSNGAFTHTTTFTLKVQ
jgi:hypothetical protein